MWAAETIRTEICVTATWDIGKRPKGKGRCVSSCLSWPFHVFCPLDFVYLFVSPIDPNALEKSLSTVLAAYPVLAGRYIDRGARVACNNKGVPLTVADMRGHSVHDIPEDPPKGAWTDIRDLERVADGEEAILTVTLTLFDDGCALGVTMNHGCSDGGSFVAFMQDWSDCHNGRQIPPVLMGLPAEALRLLSEEEAKAFPAEEFTSLKNLLQEYTDASLDKPLRQQKAASGIAPSGRQRLHFSDEALQRLKREAEEGSGHWVSTNEALMANVCTTLLQAAGVPAMAMDNCGIEVSVDLRGKVNAVPHRVLGRAVVNIQLCVDLSTPSTAGGNVHNAMRAELKESNLMFHYEVNIYYLLPYISLHSGMMVNTHLL